MSAQAGNQQGSRSVGSSTVAPAVMRLDEIIVGERVRKDMGDLASLAASIKQHGLLHPIVVKSDRTLVAGHRRLEAAKLLEWVDIPVTVIDVDDLLSAERDENAERKDFTPTEAVAIGRLIEERHRAKIVGSLSQKNSRAARVREAGRRGEDTNLLKEQLGAPQIVGATRATVAAAIGMGETKYSRAKDVVTAAEKDPQRFGDIAARMDETGNVAAAHEELRHRKGNGSAPRHAVHRKTRYPRPNQEIERSVHSLDGICICLQAINPSELDAEKTKSWAKALKKSASIISRVARKVENVKTR